VLPLQITIVLGLLQSSVIVALFRGVVCVWWLGYGLDNPVFESRQWQSSSKNLEQLWGIQCLWWAVCPLLYRQMSAAATRLHLVARLRMSGVTPPRPVYAFMAYIGTISPKPQADVLPLSLRVLSQKSVNNYSWDSVILIKTQNLIENGLKRRTALDDLVVSTPESLNG